MDPESTSFQQRPLWMIGTQDDGKKKLCLLDRAKTDGWKWQLYIWNVVIHLFCDKIYDLIF
jgi:hypothetical protein